MGVYLDGSRNVVVSRLEVIEGPSGRRRRTKAERARIAAESMMPGVIGPRLGTPLRERRMADPLLLRQPSQGHVIRCA